MLRTATAILLIEPVSASLYPGDGQVTGALTRGVEDSVSNGSSKTNKRCFSHLFRVYGIDVGIGLVNGKSFRARNISVDSHLVIS